jgi:hypothetical protein
LRGIIARMDGCGRNGMAACGICYRRDSIIKCN